VANSVPLVLSCSAETSKRKYLDRKIAVVVKQILVSPSWHWANWCNAADSWLSANTNTTVLPPPPYSPDLDPATFSYFPNWNPLWKDNDFRRFKGLREIRRRSYARSRKKGCRDCFQM
jgi:hypothetical protein